jgi:hypothetical protein
MPKSAHATAGDPSDAGTPQAGYSGALANQPCHHMSIQPPENPADAAPFPATLWFPVLLIAGLLSLALAPSPIAVLITGLIYLRRVALTRWQWKTAWAGAALGAIAAETLLLRAVIVSLWYTSGSALRQPNWGPPALSAGFVAAGAAMIGIHALAARVIAGPTPAQTTLAG